MKRNRNSKELQLRTRERDRAEERHGDDSKLDVDDFEAKNDEMPARKRANSELRANMASWTAPICSGGVGHNTFASKGDTVAAGLSSDKVALGNPYLARYNRLRTELIEMKWVDEKMNVLTHISNDLSRMQTFCRFMDTCVTPLRNRYSWAIPSIQALHTVKHNSPMGLVEIGAGTGYWCKLLSDIGTDVIAYDERPLHLKKANSYHLTPDKQANTKAFIHVHQGGPEKAALHPGRTLLLCWPPQERSGFDDEAKSKPIAAKQSNAPANDHSSKSTITIAQSRAQKMESAGDDSDEKGSRNTMALDALSYYKGDTVIYVGEWEGQTTRGCKYGENAGELFQKVLKSSFQLEASVEIPRWPCACDNLQVWKRDLKAAGHEV